MGQNAIAMFEAIESCKGTLIWSKSSILAQNLGEYPITAAMKIRAIVREPFNFAIFVSWPVTSAVMRLR